MRSYVLMKIINYLKLITLKRQVTSVDWFITLFSTEVQSACGRNNKTSAITRFFKVKTIAHINSVYYYFFIIGFYIPPTCANTSERSARSRIWYLGPFSGFAAPQIVRLLSNAKSAAKYQTTGVNSTALYDHSLLQPYSA